jgi:hypothetical protein
MCEDEQNHESFEDMVRSFAREIGRSAERITQIDVDEIAEAMGVDPDRAKEWADTAGRWLREQLENLGEGVAAAAHAAESAAHDAYDADTAPADDEPADPSPPPRRVEPGDDPLRSAAPHPLDMPTDEQGAALAALESGRWTVEPGSNRLAASGDGAEPRGGFGLVRELKARDWINNAGEVTLVGRHALTRWLEATTP